MLMAMADRGDEMRDERRWWGREKRMREFLKLVQVVPQGFAVVYERTYVGDREEVVQRM
jgi:hypothetical protein